MNQKQIEEMARDRLMENMHHDVQAAIKEGQRPNAYTMEDGEATWEEWTLGSTIFGNKQRFLLDFFFPIAQHINMLYDLKSPSVHG